MSQRASKGYDLKPLKKSIKDYDEKTISKYNYFTIQPPYEIERVVQANLEMGIGSKVCTSRY